MGTKITILDALDGYGISVILFVEFEFRALEV